MSASALGGPEFEQEGSSIVGNRARGSRSHLILKRSVSSHAKRGKKVKIGLNFSL